MEMMHSYVIGLRLFRSNGVPAGHEKMRALKCRRVGGHFILLGKMAYMANQSIHPYLRFAKKKSAICIAFVEFRKAEKVSARRENEHNACTMHHAYNKWN